MCSKVCAYLLYREIFKKNRRNKIASQVNAEELKYMLAKDQICSFVSSFADRPGHQTT